MGNGRDAREPPWRAFETTVTKAGWRSGGTGGEPIRLPRRRFPTLSHAVHTMAA